MVLQSTNEAILVDGAAEQPPDMVLPDILRWQAARLGEAPFLDVCGRQISFAGMDRLSNRYAIALRGLGLGQGERIAILLPNCLEFVVTWFAASKLGAIEVPSNPGLRGPLLVHNIVSCGARILVTNHAALAEIAKIQDQIPQVTTLLLVDATPDDARACGIRISTILPFDFGLESPDSFEPVTVLPQDPMAILYTSGTTGAAKGVVMSHRQCFGWVEAMARNLGYTSDDSYFSALPLFHTDAQMFGVYMPLVFGTRGTLVERFSASRFWEQLRACGASATNLLGAMAVILTRAPAQEGDRNQPVRVCQCIPMVPDKAGFEQRFGMTLVTGYGQTETSFVTLDTVDDFKDGTCGRPHPDWEVAIFGPDDEPLPPYVMGEIVSRPRQSWAMFSGYYNQPQKTVETLRNLWYHSGDAGYIDEEGWLYFRHRLNEAIRRRGENVSAYEVELIAEQHPAVVESAAFGVKSEFTEEDIMIVVMRRAEANFSGADVLEHFRTHAPGHMVPRYIEVTDDPLPRTPTEKISRAELKQRGVGPRTLDADRR